MRMSIHRLTANCLTTMPTDQTLRKSIYERRLATSDPRLLIEVDPYLCIGCQKYISKGPDGAFLDGCPWDAIEMIPTDDWEAMHGIALPDLPPHPQSLLMH